MNNTTDSDLRDKAQGILESFQRFMPGLRWDLESLGDKPWSSQLIIGYLAKEVLKTSRDYRLIQFKISSGVVNNQVQDRYAIIFATTSPDELFDSLKDATAYVLDIVRRLELRNG